MFSIRISFFTERSHHVPFPLSPSTSISTSFSAVSHDLVSEDQMRSAFEIADTNGDGVLTYHEAVEVSRARIDERDVCS